MWVIDFPGKKRIFMMNKTTRFYWRLIYVKKTLPEDIKKDVFDRLHKLLIKKKNVSY